MVSELEVNKCLALACEGDDEQDDQQIEGKAAGSRAEQSEFLQLEGMLLLALDPLDNE